MLYIEKRPTPRTVRDRVAEIASSPGWRGAAEGDAATIRSYFDNLPKDIIRQELLEEQHHLCAYCMSRISNDGQKMSIDHFVPLSKSKDRALDYSNFLGVCKGGADVVENRRRVLCCDASKGNDATLTINPHDREMMGYIAYRKDGYIRFRGEGRYSSDIVRSIERDLNEVLCLNGKLDAQGNMTEDTSSRIVKQRRDAYSTAGNIIKRLSDRGRLTTRALSQIVREYKAQDVWPNCAGVIFYWLERKIKELESRRK